MCIKNTKTRTKIQSKGKVSAPQKMHLARVLRKICNDFIQKNEQKFLAELKVLSNYSNQASDANLLGLGISKNGVLNIVLLV
jgi:hypothetical protein